MRSVARKTSQWYAAECVRACWECLTAKCMCVWETRGEEKEGAKGEEEEGVRKVPTEGQKGGMGLEGRRGGD